MPDAARSPFIEAARGLAPQIRAAADEVESSRRLPSPLVEAMAQAGLFRLWIPRAVGGEEADPATLVRVVEEVSRADGAAGWCVANGGEYGVFGGYLPAPAAHEIYGSDPHVRTAGALRAFGNAVVVDGGYRVTGRWSLGSGCQHSAWIVGGCQILDGDQPTSGLMARHSCAFCFFQLMTARFSTPGTVSASVEPAAMTIPSPMFLFRLSVDCRLKNTLSSQDRFTRSQRSLFSVLCWLRCRSASPGTRSIFWWSWPALR